MDKDHIITCLYKASRMQSKLPQAILDLPGFCPPKIRHFLNNLCDFRGCNYLEVGTYQGASLLSSAYGNTGIFTGIDNFSEFDGPREALKEHIATHGKKGMVHFVEGDSWEIDRSRLVKSVNVYLYDGNHSYESQKKGLLQFDGILDDRFVLMVDDYSWPDSLNGTRDALDELGYKVDLRLELHDDDNQQGWWNGLLVLLANKVK